MEEGEEENGCIGKEEEGVGRAYGGGGGGGKREEEWTMRCIG